jgi:uroporphyrinogen-III synthase
VQGALQPGAGKLIHVSGADVAGDLAGRLRAAGFSTERRIFYEAVAAAALPEEALRRLRDGRLDVVLFHSPRGARVFCELAQSAAPGASDGLIAAALSQKVAAAAGALTWRAIMVAPAPNDAALLGAAFAAAGACP